MEFTQEQKLYAEIVQKAWEDAEFKKELIVNPLEAIEKHMGVKLALAEGKTLVVRDQTDESTVHINIPAQPKHTVDVELNEEQLESVSGGVYIIDKDRIGGPIICFPPEDVIICENN
ncbi:hypothetical protein HNP38_002682 [Chryseobacterium defluvii]|uniref:Uncharacterized protein n=1 Tax=Chryseobacterium defluvii TaxID=160396 RepID=A0A840KH87_9FLAO|nr:NHLP leader peptide family RiPP precursor [Chryseobacterium defluvii]MBB4807378.1 hypothetical protein [Chryseobacterium defluvii]